VEIQIKDEKLLLVSSMIILVVIMSAFGYGWIVHEEARTGGMGEKWRMAAGETYQPNMDMIRPDGFIFFTDTEQHLISLVDREGTVEWSHNYGAALDYYQIVDGDLYLIEVSKDGKSSLDCVGMDGIWKSSTPCPPIYSFVHGDDGGIYAYGHENDNSTIYNIEVGIIKWAFTQNGSIGIMNISEDGKVLLWHTHYHSYFNITFPAFDVDEAILLSPNGLPQWSVQFPTVNGFSGSSYANVANNGTIILGYEFDGTRQTQGYTVSGDLLWNSNVSTDMSSENAVHYECQSQGGNRLHEYVEAVYKVDPLNKSNDWTVLLNDTYGGAMYFLEEVEVFLSNDGQAFGLDPNGTVLWHINIIVTGSPQCMIDHEQGMLVRLENSATKIEKDGSYWTYDGFDSSVKDLRFGPNNTVYVLTADKLVVLSKPTVSTPTEYLIAMLSVDLLIVLSSGLWIADRLVKKPN
jgi:hypothetical protein